MKSKLFALAVALAMPASTTSAATVTIAYTGIITSGGFNGPSLINQPFGLGYSFDAAPGTSELSLLNSGRAAFSTPILGGTVINGFDCDGSNCIIRMNFSATTSSYSQSASLTVFFASMSSGLSSDFPFPSDLIEAFALRGTGIGSGSFSTASSGGGVNLGLRIDTVSVNGAMVPVPLPAALPLFAAGLGIVTFLARRKKTTAVSPT